MEKFKAYKLTEVDKKIRAEFVECTLDELDPGELVVRDSNVSHPKSKKSMSFADIVKSGKITKTFTPDELKEAINQYVSGRMGYQTLAWNEQ